MTTTTLYVIADKETGKYFNHTGRYSSAWTENLANASTYSNVGPIKQIINRRCSGFSESVEVLKLTLQIVEAEEVAL